VLHIDALLLYVLILSLFNLSIRVLHRELPDVLGYATDIHVEQLIAAVNAKRQETGLQPLTLNAQLSAAAAKKAQDMFTKNYWAHNSPAGATPWDFILSSGYSYTVAGENLAKNFSNSQTVVDAWMVSVTHRDNILKPNYQDVGFAVVNGVLSGEETTLVVQMFGTPATKPISAVPQVLRPVVIPEIASQTKQQAQPSQPVVTLQPTLPPQPIQPKLPIIQPITNVASAFTGVSKTPLVNITTMTREVVFLFIGLLLGVLAVDAWLTARRRIVRIAGHNIAHMMFFTALLIALSAIERGSLL